MGTRFLSKLPSLLILLAFFATSNSIKIHPPLASKTEHFFTKIQITKAVASKSSDSSPNNLILNGHVSFIFKLKDTSSYSPINFYPEVKIDNSLNQKHHEIRAPTKRS